MDARLSAFYGLPAETHVGYLNLSFSGTGSPPGPFVSTQVFGTNLEDCSMP